MLAKVEEGVRRGKKSSGVKGGEVRQAVEASPAFGWQWSLLPSAISSSCMRSAHRALCCCWRGGDAAAAAALRCFYISTFVQKRNNSPSGDNPSSLPLPSSILGNTSNFVFSSNFSQKVQNVLQQLLQRFRFDRFNCFVRFGFRQLKYNIKVLMCF